MRFIFWTILACFGFVRSVGAQPIPLDLCQGINANWFQVDTNIEFVDENGIPIPKPWGPGLWSTESCQLHLNTSGPVPPLVPLPAEPDPSFFDPFNSGFMATGWVPSLADAAFSNGRLRATVRAGADSNVDLLLRADPVTFSGYAMAGLGSYGELHFSRLDNGQVIRDEVVPGVSFSDGEEWNFEFGAAGHRFSMKAWKVSESEPVKPQLIVYDDTYAAGALGLSASVSTNNIAEPKVVHGFFSDVEFTPEVQVISPSRYSDREAPNLNTVTAPFRFQQLYPAQDFEIHGPHLITEVAFRPDGTGTSPNSSTTADLQLLLSITSKDANNLSSTFDNNIGTDHAKVFEGPLTLTSMNVGPSGGPKEFDMVIPLQTPFLFDPDDGNLLGEIIQRAPLNAALRNDGFGSPSNSIFAQSPNARTGGRVFGGVVTQFTLVPVAAGDFDGNSVLDAADIDLLTQAVNEGLSKRRFDVDQDGIVSANDRNSWIAELKGTYFGDSNLDGEFNSSDLISIFKAGEYEDNVSKNSTWETGDWNGDWEFDSSDLVEAFQDGGYEIGPRQLVASVPEPAMNMLPGMVMLLLWRRRTHLR